jgi:hypothetical protein
VSAAAAAAAGPPARGAVQPRLGRRRLLILFGIGIAAVAGIAALIAALAEPGQPAPLCKPYTPCGQPPKVEHALVNNAVWRSSSLGYSLEYPKEVLHVASETPDGVVLEPGNKVVTYTVRGKRESEASPQALFDDQISFLKGNLVGLAADTDPAHELLGTNVGLVPGPGGVYGGVEAAPQGIGKPKELDVMAAGDGQVSVVVTANFGTDVKPDTRDAILQLGDEVFKSVQWGSRSG